MYKRTVDPLTNALTLAEAKEQLRVLDTSEDTFIQGLIEAAEEVAEAYTNRVLISSTWEYTLDDFPGYIRINKTPVTAVNSITYTDSDGVLQTLAADQYEVRYSEPAVIIPKKAWPGTEYGLSKVKVEFVAGWADAASVPKTIKTGMKLLLSHLYDNRSDVVEARTLSELPQGSKYFFGFERIKEF